MSMGTCEGRLVEFSPRTMKMACWVSFFVAMMMMSSGAGLLLAPETVVHFLLDLNIAQSQNSKEALLGLARMSAGIMSAQGLSCLILLVPSFRASGNDILKSCTVTSNRLSIGMQFISGLCWLVVGLMDDRVVHVMHGGYRRKSFGLLIAGFAVAILSCLALMMTFWSSHRSLNGMQAINDSQISGGLGEDAHIAEPLLSGERDVPVHVDSSVSSSSNSSSNVHTATEEGTTSGDDEHHGSTPRVRGTLRLLKLAKPQVLYLYIGCATLLIRLPFSLCIPHFVSTSLGALAKNDFHQARHEILWLFILGSVDALLDFWCIFWFGFSNLRIVKACRIDTFAAILRQEVEFFDRHTSGELSSRLNSDCGEMAGDLTWFFRFSIESVVRILGITTYMIVRSPRLAICALSIAPIVAGVNKLYGNWLGENSRKVQDALASANSVAQETFGCVRTVIAFAAEQVETEKYIEKINEQYRLQVQQTYLTGVYYMFISTFLVNTVVQGTLLLCGSFMIERGQLSGQILLAFMLYQGQLQNEMMNLFQSYSSLIKSSGAGDKVFGLLDRLPPAPATGSSLVQATGGTATPITDTGALSVQLRGVSFLYGSRPEHRVLKGLTLDIAPGQTLALIGRSGCGKSTIVGLLQRYFDPTGGKILINGVDLRDLDIKCHRKRIGVVTQNPVLFSGTILSNITYGVTGVTMEQVEEAAKIANAHEFILRFPNGYNTPVGERGVQLSGGQSQRIAVARAIIRSPSLLLLDEATSALDAESEEIVQAALDNLLSRNRKITTIVIAHRLHTVRNASVIAVVDDGQIVEMGAHHELMQSPNGYYRGMVEKSIGKTLATER